MRLAPLTRLPPAVLGIVKEAARLILRRPVVGVAAIAKTSDGRWVLVRRGDTGTWALPGGTLEWGETIRELLARELREEAGVELRSIGKLMGVYSRPDRDSRFHGVTILVACEVGLPERAPMNMLEISEVGVFADRELPGDLAMGMTDMLNAAREAVDPIIE